MRALFTCQAATGHLNSLIPVADALTVAGHEVAFCSSPSFRTQVEPWGFSYVGIGPEADEIRADLPERPPPGPDRWRWAQRYFFAGASAQQRFPDLLALVRDWRPDELEGRPLVLASMGTTDANQTPGLLEAILDGLGDADLSLVLASGRGHDPSRFGVQPSNVRIEPYVPQRSLLPECDLFITHGGFNSVKEALSVGVPLVVIPIGADQFYCAERCAALGVAEVIDPDRRAPESIAHAATTVLGDPSYRTNAARFQAEMAALPGPEHAVALPEQLVTTGEPVERS